MGRAGPVRRRPPRTLRHTNKMLCKLSECEMRFENTHTHTLTSMWEHAYDIKKNKYDDEIYANDVPNYLVAVAAERSKRTGMHATRPSVLNIYYLLASEELAKRSTQNRNCISSGIYGQVNYARRTFDYIIRARASLKRRRGRSAWTCHSRFSSLVRNKLSAK